MEVAGTAKRLHGRAASVDCLAQLPPGVVEVHSRRRKEFQILRLAVLQVEPGKRSAPGEEEPLFAGKKFAEQVVLKWGERASCGGVHRGATPR